MPDHARLSLPPGTTSAYTAMSRQSGSDKIYQCAAMRRDIRAHAVIAMRAEAPPPTTGARAQCDVKVRAYAAAQNISSSVPDTFRSSPPPRHVPSVSPIPSITASPSSTRWRTPALNISPAPATNYSSHAISVSSARPCPQNRQPCPAPFVAHMPPPPDTPQAFLPPSEIRALACAVAVLLSAHTMRAGMRCVRKECAQE